MSALVSGAFSLISAAISMGLCPPLHVKHTSDKILGQIYIPEVNYLLMILTIAIVAAFQQSTTITSAYGVTVGYHIFLLDLFHNLHG